MPSEPSGHEEARQPAGACANTRNASHIGADMNHLCPVMMYSAPGPPELAGMAVVVLARTSVPPCFSVMPMPLQTLRFALAGWKLLSYSRLKILGSHTAARSGCTNSAGTAAWSWCGTLMPPPLDRHVAPRRPRHVGARVAAA